MLRGAFLLCILGLVTVLGACSASGNTPASGAVTGASGSSSTAADAENPPMPKRRALSARDEVAALTDVAAEATVAALPLDDDKPEQRDDNVADPEQLMGLDAASLQGLLGPPRLRRVDGPAEVWQYSTPECILDAYLYETKAGAADHRVTYYEVRGPAEDTTADRTRCFADLVIARRVAQEAESR
jgi:hypothetical protein